MDYCCPPHNSIFVYLLLKQPSEFWIFKHIGNKLL
jgi:hypothetical protein